MKIVEIPDHLAEKVGAAGADLAPFVVKAVEEKLANTALISPGTLGEKIRGGWVPPTVNGSARSDGVPWSEIEAAADPS